MTNSLSIDANAFVCSVSMSASFDETLLLGRWTCLQVSESYRLVWKSLIKARVLRFVCIDMEANACSSPFQSRSSDSA